MMNLAVMTLLRYGTGSAIAGLGVLLAIAPLAQANAVKSPDGTTTTAATASCDAVALTPTKTISLPTGATKSATAIIDTENVGWVDFSAAESDASVILFGCDCSACMNALQQLRQPTLVASIQGHCWSNLTTNNTSPDRIADVLAAVAAAEAISPDTPLNWPE